MMPPPVRPNSAGAPRVTMRNSAVASADSVICVPPDVWFSAEMPSTITLFTDGDPPEIEIWFWPNDDRASSDPLTGRTPGTSPASAIVLRPISGMSRTRCAEMTVLCVVVSVSSVGAVAVTLTTSVLSASWSWASRRSTCASLSCRLPRVTGRKPGSSTVTE